MPPWRRPVEQPFRPRAGAISSMGVGWAIVIGAPAHTELGPRGPADGQNTPSRRAARRPPSRGSRASAPAANAHCTMKMPTKMTRLRPTARAPPAPGANARRPPAASGRTAWTSMQYSASKAEEAARRRPRRHQRRQHDKAERSYAGCAPCGSTLMPRAPRGSNSPRPERDQHAQVDPEQPGGRLPGGVAPATRVSHGPAHSDWMATMPPKLIMPSGEARPNRLRQISNMNLARRFF